MPDRLTDLVERAELAIASSSGVVDEERLEPMIDLVKTLRMRMSYPDEVMIVALAGGTGSGKSSLFNVLAGADLVEVGGLRPTTSEPAAAIPRRAGAVIDGFLDHLEIRRRYEHDGPLLCIVDLPDTDSVEVGHHQRVDRVLPYVDAVVWVTDPEKYRDARLHHDYLSRLANYSFEFVVALNQIDRLHATDLGEVLADLSSALRADDLSDVVVVPVAAAPLAGPPIGVETLVGTLETMRESRDMVAMKLLTDLGAIATDLAAEAGTGIDFDTRSREAVDDAVASLEEGDPSAAIQSLTGFLDRIGDEVGGPTGRAVARATTDVPAHVSRIISELDPAIRRRSSFRRRAASFDRRAAGAKLEAAVIRPARVELAKRAVALATIADLAVEVESLRSTQRRYPD